jgi:hypothetical protein
MVISTFGASPTHSPDSDSSLSPCCDPVSVRDSDRSPSWINSTSIFDVFGIVLSLTSLNPSLELDSVVYDYDEFRSTAQWKESSSHSLSYIIYAMTDQESSFPVDSTGCVLSSALALASTVLSPSLELDSIPNDDDFLNIICFCS